MSPSYLKAIVLSILVGLTVCLSSLPYYNNDVLREHLEPYGTDKVCLGTAPDSMSCMTKSDFQLFQDKRISPDVLCLGNPPVCINESHLRLLTDGFKLRSKENGWHHGMFFHTHSDRVMRLADERYKTTYKLLPVNHDSDPRWRGQ